MPDINGMKVVIIGSGPTTIGNTGEIHEGALEACRALSAMGCDLITVDSNPDAPFNAAPWSQLPLIEPLTTETISHIIKTEKPDALLPLFSGRNGLHMMSKLYESNILLECNVLVWGPSKNCLDSIRDRDCLNSALTPIKLTTPSIFTVNGMDAAIEKAQQLGFPVVFRCDDAYLLPDGLLVYNQDELNHIGSVLAGEPESKFAVEASLLEWQQIELEILRDTSGDCRIIGSVEYIDTAAVHPGDSIGVCPPQTLTPTLKTLLYNQALAIADHLGIAGNATIRFAYHPIKEELFVLAVHPRYTTASALVTRMTGVPIAMISTLFAAGVTWAQLPSNVPLPSDNYEKIDNIGIKWPRWDFKRIGDSKDRLGPQMQATGHSTAYGKNFKETFQKAARSGRLKNNSLLSIATELDKLSHDELLSRITTPSSKRPYEIFAALQKGISIEEIEKATHILPWFIEQFKAIADTTDEIKAHRNQMPADATLHRAKAEGFSDYDLSHLLAIPETTLKSHLDQINVSKCWKTLPGRGRYLRFGTFDQTTSLPEVDGDKKIVILGNGATGIGNGDECDNGIFHAAQTVKKLGYTPIIINNNLSGITTGPGTFCTCYCDPLTLEDIDDVLRAEEPVGLITQFSGTATRKLTSTLESAQCNALGTPLKTLKLLQNRISFKERMRHLGIAQPAYGRAQTAEEANQTASRIGYPVLISDIQRSDSALISDAQALEDYLSKNSTTDDTPLWIEQLLEYAIEGQAEVLCDGKNIHTLAIIEHIELAGVHAGDSAAVLPPYSISPRHLDTINDYCRKIATDLSIKGLVNIRFGIYRDTVYLLDVCSHISRNLGMLSKSLNIPVVEWATRLILDEPLSDLGIRSSKHLWCGVRAPVFAFHVFSKTDPLLGPNMQATGQVMALSDSFGMAYFKALASTATPLPTKGTVLITVTDEDKASILEPARIFSELGFDLMATRGTHDTLSQHGIESVQVRKLGFGRPNLVDEIKNGNVQMVINTPTSGQGQIDDSIIRKAAIDCRIVNITTPASALAAARGIAAAIEHSSE